MTTRTHRIRHDAREVLRPALRGTIYPSPHRPVGFNRIHNGEAAVTVAATGPGDVAEAVRFAARRGVPIGVHATGHGPALSPSDALLVDTSAMNAVHIDPASRTARVEAGTTWSTVIHEAARHGLAPLNGASPSVGVVGYTLGGGHGPLGRSYGYAADHVRALDVVTADGRLLTASPQQNRDLFWGLRGGKGNFGVVTAMVIELFEVAGLYGGGLFLPGEAAPEFLPAWRDWTRDLPDAMHTALSLTRFPDDRALPAQIRDRFLIHVRIAYNGPAAQAQQLVAPLRAIAEPVLDTTRWMPYSAVADVHMDPTDPGVYYERSRRLYDLPDDAIASLIALTGPSGTVPLPSVEIRLLGGALARPPATANAVPFRQAGFTLFTGVPVTPGTAGRVQADQQQLITAFEPWSVGGPFLSFISPLENSIDDVRSAYEADTYTRLVDLKDRFDPTNLLRINHNIPPTSLGGGHRDDHRA